MEDKSIWDYMALIGMFFGIAALAFYGLGYNVIAILAKIIWEPLQYVLYTYFCGGGFWVFYKALKG